jgi:maltose/moltooligosaccharide transporter
MKSDDKPPAPSEVTVCEPAAKPLIPVSFFYILALAMLSVGTSSVSFCSNQVLPLTLRKFTDSTALIGFVVALQALNQLWVTPYAAWKSDRIWTRIGRRRPLVLIVTPLLAVTIMLVPHCPSLLLIIPWVFILQMAEDADQAVLMPSICDSVPDKQRPLATAMWQVAVGISVFLMGRYVMKLMDPGLHNVTLRFVGWLDLHKLGVRLPHIPVMGAEHWPYTISGIAVLVTGAIFLIVMRERYVPPRPQDRFRLFSYGKEVLRIREHKLIYIVFFFQPLFYLVAIAYFPLLGRDVMHLKPSEYGAAYAWGAATTLLTSIPLGWLFNRFRHRRAFCIGACAYVILPITFGLFFMHTARDMAIFFCAQILAFNVFRLNFMPYVMEYTTHKNVGTILGFTTAVNGLVRFTLVPLAGLLVDIFGRNYKLPLYGGYLGAVVCIIALLMMRPPEKVSHLLGDG